MGSAVLSRDQEALAVAHEQVQRWLADEATPRSARLIWKPLYFGEVGRRATLEDLEQILAALRRARERAKRPPRDDLATLPLFAK